MERGSVWIVQTMHVVTTVAQFLVEIGNRKRHAAEIDPVLQKKVVLTDVRTTTSCGKSGKSQGIQKGSRK